MRIMDRTPSPRLHTWQKLSLALPLLSLLMIFPTWTQPNAGEARTADEQREREHELRLLEEVAQIESERRKEELLRAEQKVDRQLRDLLAASELEAREGDAEAAEKLREQAVHLQKKLQIERQQVWAERHAQQDTLRLELQLTELKRAIEVSREENDMESARQLEATYHDLVSQAKHRQERVRRQQSDAQLARAEARVRELKRAAVASAPHSDEELRQREANLAQAQAAYERALAQRAATPPTATAPRGVPRPDTAPRPRIAATAPSEPAPRADQAVSLDAQQRLEQLMAERRQLSYRLEQIEYEARVAAMELERIDEMTKRLEKLLKEQRRRSGRDDNGVIY